MTAVPPVIVLGTSYTALPIARSLGRRGIPLRGFDLDGPGPAAHSRYLAYVDGPGSEAELEEALLRLADAASEPPVVFPTSDRYLLFLAGRGAALAERVRVPAPLAEVLASLVSKRGTAACFEAHGIPQPRTAVVEARAPDWAALASFRFPVIVKPDLHDRWLGNPAFRAAHGFQKALLVRDQAEAHRLLPGLLRFDDLVVQEYVPGPSEHLFYYVGYRSRAGRHLVSFVGRKRRTYPEGLGTETLLESVREDGVARLGDAVLERIGGHGVAGVDCKFDARDGTFRVIEANWRFGTSDGLLLACGVDLPWIVYRDLRGEPVAAPSVYRTGVFWSWLERDVDWMRDQGGGASAWLRWLGGLLRTRPRGIVFSWRDPLPFVHEARRLLRRLARGLRARFRG